MLIIRQTLDRAKKALEKALDRIVIAYIVLLITILITPALYYFAYTKILMVGP